MKKIIDVFEDYEDLRIDKFLAENLEDMSRSYIQSLIKDEKVLVNSSSCKAKYNVKCGDVIEIDIPELTEPEIDPAKAAKPKSSLHYRVPAICTVTLSNDDRDLVSMRIPVYQLGREEVYPITK